MKKIATTLLAGSLALSLVACGGSSQPQSPKANASSSQEASSSEQSSAAAAPEAKAETKPETQTETQAPAAPAKTYDSIYDDYSAQLVAAGQTAVSEFNAESEGVTDITQLAALANSKITTLAAICMNGGQEMASLMLVNGDDYSTYEAAWYKLYAVYNEQGMNVYSAYFDRYTEAIPGMTEEMKQQMLDQYQTTLESMAPKPQQ